MTKEINSTLIITMALEVDTENPVNAPYIIKIMLDVMSGNLKLIFNLLRKRKTAPPNREICRPEIESRWLIEFS